MMGRPGRGRHRAEVVLELGGRRHVHHGRQHHQTVGAQALRIAGEIGRRGGRELRDAGDDGRLAGTHFDRGAAARCASPPRSANCPRPPFPSTPGHERHRRATPFAPVAWPANRLAVEASNCVVAAGNTPDQEQGLGFRHELRPIWGCLQDRRSYTVRPWVSKIRSQ